MSMSLSPNLPPDKQREMLRQMLTIRRFEERASADYHVGKIYGVVHCYIGEEAVAVGVCSALDRGDRIISTHRGHGHCIAKGMLRLQPCCTACCMYQRRSSGVFTMSRIRTTAS